MITLPQIDTSSMLTTADFAKLINSKADTVQKYCQRNIISGAVKAGHSWLIPRDQVEKFKKNRRTRGRPPKVA
jgi:excisionase family DNA binding protein